MRRLALLVVFASLLLAGCSAGPTAPSDASPTPTDVSETPTLTPTPPGSSPPTATRVQSPTASATDAQTGSFGGATIEYVVRVGEIPGEFASANATLQVVFVDSPADLGPCYPEVFSGPYKPTITPLRTPSGECHRSDPITVDLTGERSLVNVTAPDSARGHALLLTDLSVRLANGTAVEAIKGIGGAELVESSRAREGAYGIELGIEAPPGERDYEYWVVWERFDPAES